MSNRFSRDPARASLFSSYDNRSSSPSKSKPSRPPSGSGPGYGYTPPPDHLAANGPAFAAYPGASGSASPGLGLAQPGYRPATPNSRGQYSSATLEELESQNEGQVGVLSGKVRELKNLTTLIGDEIRSSSALADKMNDQFENSRLRLRGTMNRMLDMARKTGVGWRVWLGFFVAVGVLFWWVWLF